MESQSLENRVGRLISHARQVQDEELRAELTKYLCILIASLIEKKCTERIARFVASKSAPVIEGFVLNQLSRIPKVAGKDIRDLFRRFNADVAEAWYEDLSDENRDALDSIKSNRNLLAHGDYIGLSLGQLMGYKRRSDEALSSLFGRF